MDGGGLSCHRTLSHLSGDCVAPWRSARLVLPDHEGAVRGERRNLSRVQRGRGLARSVAPVRHGLHPVSGTGEAPADAPVPGRTAARGFSQAAGGISANTGDSTPVENAPSAGGSFRCAERLWSTRASGRRPRRILRAHRHLGRLRLSQAGPPTVSGGLYRIASRPGRGDFRGKRPLPRRLRSAAGWDEDDLVLPSRQPWRISRNRAGLYSLSIRRPPPRDRIFRGPIARSKRIDASQLCAAVTGKKQDWPPRNADRHREEFCFVRVDRRSSAASRSSWNLPAKPPWIVAVGLLCIDPASARGSGFGRSMRPAISAFVLGLAALLGAQQIPTIRVPVRLVSLP